jgi:predicted phosphohydrolase
MGAETKNQPKPEPIRRLELEDQSRMRLDGVRELLRLEMALSDADRLAAGRPVVAMLHYPPLYDSQRDTAFTELLTAHGVHTAVYGHLHGAGIRAGFSGTHRGVRYLLTSCDSLDFTLAEIDEQA